MPFDARQTSDIIDLYRSGLTGDEIARRLNIGRFVVYYRLKRSGIARRRKGLRDGHTPWNKGVKLDEAQKARLNLSGLNIGHHWNKGKAGIYSPAYLEKLSVSHTGKRREMSSHWKGGVSFTNERRSDMPRYKVWRCAVYERDGYQCQKCGDKSAPGHPVFLEAHHMQSFAQFPETRYDVNNGQTLCEDCHRKIHWPKYRSVMQETQIV